MRWIGFALGLIIFTGVTGGAVMASIKGVGLPGMLDKPISIRQQSVSGSRHRSGGMFIYFGSRRHYGGGYRGGK